MGCGASKADRHNTADVPPEQTKGGPKLGQAKPEVTVLDAKGKGAEYARSLFSQEHAALNELVVSECELRSIPAEISKLSSLAKLDISSNILTELPAEFGSLVHLEELDMNDNTVKSLPEEFGSLKSLSKLLMYKNALVSLPDAIGNLTELNELNFFNNKVLKLPPSLGKLSKLEEVNFSANKIMKIDAAAIEQWHSLKVLNAFDCRIMMLPSLGHLAALEELRMFGNNLNAMPSFGDGLPNLRVLELHRNNIVEIPDGFFKGMQSMTKLTISSNGLTCLPSDISECSLETLLCEDNKLTDLPKELATLSTLRVLLANGNKISVLADEWKNNKGMTRINLKGNPIVGSADVLDHLREVTTGNGGMFWDPRD